MSAEESRQIIFKSGTKTTLAQRHRHGRIERPSRIHSTSLIVIWVSDGTDFPGRLGMGSLTSLESPSIIVLSDG